MTMQCVKTGCHLYSREYGYFFLGDLYSIGNVYVLKCWGKGSRTYAREIRPLVNCVVSQYFQFWECGDWYICMFEASDVELLSYEGVDLPDL